MKTGIKQRQFVGHGDYSSTANCPTKRKSRIFLGTFGILSGISVFLIFPHHFFGKNWFGNTALNTI
jgi:hypothetical protein